MASTHPDHWTDEELALHVAYEQAAALRAHYTFERALQEPAVAHALRLAGKAWLRKRGNEQHAGDALNDVSRETHWSDL